MPFPLMLAALALPAADPSGGDALAKALRGRVAEAPVTCIDPHDVISTQIIPGTAIVYDTGRRVYVNRPDGVERLRQDDVLVQRIQGGQLCRIDTIELFDQFSRVERGFIILGDFTPYVRPDKPAGTRAQRQPASTQ